jgi:RNA polymerase sigma-70 factor (ECF subfamily)
MTLVLLRTPGWMPGWSVDEATGTSLTPRQVPSAILRSCRLCYLLVVSESDRDNAEWVRTMVLDGPAGDAARRDLRTLLVGGLRRALASRGVGEDVCEDFAQEALVRVRERLGTFRGDSRFTTWALSVATRLAFDELRHKRWKDVSFEALTEDAHAPVTFEPRAEANQERGLARERVLGVLALVLEHGLTDKQRAVLSAELQGMPQSEIAAQLGMNRNALYKLAHDARKRVKAGLEEAGLFAADVLPVFE